MVLASPLLVSDLAVGVKPRAMVLGQVREQGRRHSTDPRSDDQGPSRAQDEASRERDCKLDDRSDPRVSLRIGVLHPSA